MNAGNGPPFTNIESSLFTAPFMTKGALTSTVAFFVGQFEDLIKPVILLCVLELGLNKCAQVPRIKARSHEGQ